MHATVVIRGLTLAIETALAAVERLAFDVDVADRASMLKVLNSCIGTKFTSRFGPLMAELALDAVTTVAHVPDGAPEGSPPEVDTKRYAKVEKLPGGDISDCRVLKGVMFNKDVVAPGRMRRTIRKVSVFGRGGGGGGRGGGKKKEEEEKREKVKRGEKTLSFSLSQKKKKNSLVFFLSKKKKKKLDSTLSPGSSCSTALSSTKRASPRPASSSPRRRTGQRCSSSRRTTSAGSARPSRRSSPTSS